MRLIMYRDQKWVELPTVGLAVLGVRTGTLICNSLSACVCTDIPETETESHMACR